MILAAPSASSAGYQSKAYGAATTLVPPGAGRALAASRPDARGASTAPISEAVIRLLECLKCPLDSRLLDRQTVREIVYRVLRGEQISGSKIRVSVLASVMVSNFWTHPRTNL